MVSVSSPAEGLNGYDRKVSVAIAMHKDIQNLLY